MKKSLTVVISGIILASTVYFFSRPAYNDQPSSTEQSTTHEVPANSITGMVENIAAKRPRPRHTGFLLNHGSSTNGNQTLQSKIMTAEEQARLNDAFTTTTRLTELLDDGNDSEALQEARKLASNPNPEVRMAVLQALKWIGSPAAADLATLTGDADPEISKAANEAFWDTIDEIDDPQLTIEMLKIPLQSSNAGMREEAIDRLVFLPEQLAFPIIASMLNDSNIDVRNLAKDNLEFISSEEFESAAQAMAWFNDHRNELEQLDSL